VDLLLAVAESSLGNNHPIKRENTRRSVLWYGPDFLSNAGVQDGFDKTTYINNFHLGMNIDPRVVTGVLQELKDLATWERGKDTIMTASLGPMTRMAQADAATASDAASDPEPPMGWPAMRLPIKGDITCRQCWGLTQNLAGIP
jgi:hypothetical protein